MTIRHFFGSMDQNGTTI